MLNVTRYEQKVNENENETPPHTEWLKLERLTIPNAAEDVEQVEPSYVAVNWSVNQYSHFRKLSILLKSKCTLSI